MNVILFIKKVLVQPFSELLLIYVWYDEQPVTTKLIKPL